MTTKAEERLKRLETRLQRLEEQVGEYLDLHKLEYQISSEYKELSEEFGVPDPRLLLRAVTFIPESISHFALKSLPYSSEEISNLSNLEEKKQKKYANEEEIEKSIESIIGRIDQISGDYGFEPPQTPKELRDLRKFLRKELTRIYSAEE